MKASTDTRDLSYRSLANVQDKRESVLRVIEDRGPISDRAIAAVLGWTINRVTGRRNELVESGQVERARKERDPHTGITVSLWQATNV